MRTDVWLYPPMITNPKLLLACAAVAATASVSANAALIAHYKLNEAAGSTTIVDSSVGGIGNAAGTGTGVTLGSTTVTAGTYGAITVDVATAASFGTSADFSGGKFDVNTTGSATIASLLTKNGTGAPTGTYTLMAWINSDANNDRFFLGSGSADNNGWKWGINNQQAFVTAGIQQGLGGGSNISTTGWQHVAFSYNNGVGNFYLNGNLTGTVNYLNYNEDGAGSITSIGARPVTGSEAFDGQLDELKIFNTALTVAEIGVAAVPEPSAALLGGLGLLALLRRRRNA